MRPISCCTKLAWSSGFTISTAVVIQMTPSSFSAPKRPHLTQGIILIEHYPNYRAILQHFIGTAKTIQKGLKLLEENLHSFSVPRRLNLWNGNTQEVTKTLPKIVWGWRKKKNKTTEKGTFQNTNCYKSSLIQNLVHSLLKITCQEQIQILSHLHKYW